MLNLYKVRILAKYLQRYSEEKSIPIDSYQINQLFFLVE